MPQQQTPQGIFQSIQYLLKKVKILALTKQPTYSVTTASVAYTIPGMGVYEITTASTSNNLNFPDPTLLNGQSITIINSGAVTQVVNSINSPSIRGTATLVSTGGIAAGSEWIFISINGKWRGGILS